MQSTRLPQINLILSLQKGPQPPVNPFYNDSEEDIKAFQPVFSVYSGKTVLEVPRNGHCQPNPSIQRGPETVTTAARNTCVFKVSPQLIPHVDQVMCAPQARSMQHSHSASTASAPMAYPDQFQSDKPVVAPSYSHQPHSAPMHQSSFGAQIVDIRHC